MVFPGFSVGGEIVVGEWIGCKAEWGKPMFVKSIMLVPSYVGTTAL
jgi:hypothetical protein